jgi:hypothetical protein
MKQPNFARFDQKNSLEKEYKQDARVAPNIPDFDQKTQQMQSNLKLKKQNIRAKIDDSMAKNNIEKEAQSIKSKSEKIKQKVDERADKLAAKAAWDKLIEKE